MMLNRRMFTLPTALLAVALLAAPPALAGIPESAPATSGDTAPQPLEPWQPVETRFNGCEGGCGVRRAGPSTDVVVQPGAVRGQQAYCLVSGVVFKVKWRSAHREVGGNKLYFCCEACAEYFSLHQDLVLGARKVAL